MSWFKNIVSGVGAGVNWISQASGTISKAATAIAKVADALNSSGTGFEDGEVDEAAAQDYIADMQPNFNIANKYLLQVAQEKLAIREQQAASEFELNAATEDVTVHDLTGIWTSPTQTDGEPPLGVYQDLNKFLYQEGIPTSITETPPQGASGFVGFGGLFDVALNISKSIFSSLFREQSDFDDEAKHRGVKTRNFEVNYEDRGFKLVGVHASYPLPMGEAGEQQAWHTGLHMKKITTQKFRDEQTQFRRQAHFLSASSSIDPKANHWNVTLQVPWTTEDTATNALIPIATYIGDNYKNLAVKFNQKQGLNQVIKIEADANSNTPATIRYAVTEAAGYVVNASNNPRSLRMAAKQPVNIIATGLEIPDVQITSTAIVISSGSKALQASMAQHSAIPQQAAPVMNGNAAPAVGLPHSTSDAYYQPTKSLNLAPRARVLSTQ